jgi:hypothetical protein
MYGLIQGKRILAIHDDRDVISAYQDTLENDFGIKSVIGKIDKKKIKNRVEYFELYLVRYGDNYVPSKFFMTARNTDDQAAYDLKYAHDILMRILKYSTDEKDQKHLIKSLSIIQRELDNCYNNPLNPLNIEEIKNMNEKYKDRFLSE